MSDEKQSYTPSVDDEIETLSVALFEMSHEPSFADDPGGMEEARRFARRVVVELIEVVRAEERISRTREIIEFVQERDYALAVAIDTELAQRHPDEAERVADRYRVADGVEADRAQPGMVECPHWAPGRITLRPSCTACEKERKDFEEYSKGVQERRGK